MNISSTIKKNNKPFNVWVRIQLHQMTKELEGDHDEFNKSIMREL